jgi:hypothetical protein
LICAFVPTTGLVAVTGGVTLSESGVWTSDPKVAVVEIDAPLIVVDSAVALYVTASVVVSVT